MEGGSCVGDKGMLVDVVDTCKGDDGICSGDVDC